MDHQFLTDGLGYAAATLTTTAFLPQAIQTWRTRRADDLSLAMFLLFIAGVVMWLAYGIVLSQWPIIVANIVTLGLAGSILYVKIRSLTARAAGASPV